MHSWQSLVDAYTTQLATINRSAGTIRQHRNYLAALARAHPNPLDVTRADLLAELGSHGWGPCGKKSARTVWRGFYKYLHGEGLMETWIGETLPAITMPNGIPRPADAASINRVCTDPDDRIRLMSLLAAKDALRAGEIARVHSDDYDPHQRALLVHGKGRKQRLIPVASDQLHDMLSALDGWAFPSPHPRCDHLTPGTITKLLSDALGPKWTAHNLRHAAATAIVDDTGDLMAARDFLGHATVATTQIYSKTSLKRLWAAAEAAAHPR
ncbi:MAG: tyrosine-type recombinase/integrase [Aeromicrobium sp.]|uniref:tyrosine-type recombinase/integrase n=1 Tax=Aeromicrobium sp. TaxID=1871063 RepID=UPI0039E5F360